MANEIWVPELNPVTFYETDLVNLPKYFTKHLEDYPFEQRLYYFNDKVRFKQIWQKEDIIYLQFESTFSTIVVRAVDAWGQVMQDFPALFRIANASVPGKFAYEVAISLADFPHACFFLKMILGSEGPEQKILVSNKQFCSRTPVANSLLFEYWHTRKFHRDVMFVTGIKFQVRMPGVFGLLDKPRKDELYRDELYNNTILKSRSAKVFPLFLFPEYGAPDEMVNLVDHIWSCNNVKIDNKLFGAADGFKLEYVTLENYPKRGIKLMVENGINRNSRVFGINLDTTKRLITTIEVETQVFGDLSGQESSNEIPTTNALPEIE